MLQHIVAHFYAVLVLGSVRSGYAGNSDLLHIGFLPAYMHGAACGNGVFVPRLLCKQGNWPKPLFFGILRGIQRYDSEEIWRVAR